MADRFMHWEIRRSYDRLISTMGFPILVRCHLYIEPGPSAMVYRCCYVVAGVASLTPISCGPHHAARVTSC